MQIVPGESKQDAPPKTNLKHTFQVKKEQLTKGQKRNAWKKGGLNEDDRQRGWNWVDVVK